MRQLGNKTHGLSGRERLMATALDLFMRRGVSNVGINEVTDSAGVAKMTLYNNFSSKESLTLAVYERLAEAVLHELSELDTADKSEQERILALFDYFDAKTRDADFRGCPFIHASLQAAEPAGPVHELVRTYKRSLRLLLLSRLDKERPDRSVLADQLLILLDGAVTQSHLKAVAHPANAARRAIAALLAH